MFALLQKKTARKEIADIVGISQSTLLQQITDLNLRYIRTAPNT
ncbi:helix-turn-helix domain-containing protein [Prevotella melaninogenica]|uniref:Helix-turn-helix domain-containing protein n=1 Tax=Prevotella melaninogenica TaxID=28132 RepID=A0A7D4G9A3_9BACT|nr:helix-turn-helix domain-containing protein [Prevotella melaninogenica]QKH89855.1 helix-turn-helix domain-containing protein [Prevotella melaninogenica]